MTAPKTRQEVESFAEEGFSCVKSGQYRKALRIAKMLEKSRYSACFEIAALAYGDMGKKKKAVDVLRKGVEKVPDVWVNWELLGNYLSDLQDYKAAEEAYSHALECPGVWTDSVLLNVGVVEGRKGNYERSLEILDRVRDVKLRLPVLAMRIAALEDLERYDELIACALDALVEQWPNDEDLEPLARISASLAKAWLEQEHNRDAVRAVLERARQYDPENRRVLDLIEITNTRPG